MLLKFLCGLNIKRILLAGMDGYSYDEKANYAEEKMELYTQRALLRTMNEGMSQALSEFSQNIEIRFLTDPRHVTITR